MCVCTGRVVSATAFYSRFPKPEGMTHVLIDCGVLRGTEDGMQQMQAVVKHIGETTDHHLDVVVVTHEHWDHVSGFQQAVEQFKSLTIDNVWLAWTEDPDDGLADQLRGYKLKALQALSSARQKLAALQLGADSATPPAETPENPAESAAEKLSAACGGDRPGQPRPVFWRLWRGRCAKHHGRDGLGAQGGRCAAALPDPRQRQSAGPSRGGRRARLRARAAPRRRAD